jgi:hypothetical protein
MRAIGKPRSVLRTSAVAALVLASAAPARAEEPAASIGSRLYAGLELSSVKVDDSYGGVGFNASTLSFGAYAGFWANDRLAVELSYDRTDPIDLHDLAGSGVVRFDVASQRRTLSLSVLRQVVLRDFLNLKRDWRVFGALGVYDTEVDRTITDLGSGAQTSAGESVTGAVVAAGVLYTVGRVELRGYLRGWGDAREIGAAAQLRF